ncbi:substrate-binding periplasmic protein [Marinobacter sp.]|uniref:substrate-binding periplasmic protein n=1 Tax=Marinobacter sp. TaxID=50741 RepID=UPI0035655DA9
MKRLIHSLSLALLAGVLMAAAGAVANDEKVIRAAFIEFPPLATRNDNGQPEGSFIRMTEQVAQRAGYSIQWQELPIGRVYLYLEQGEIDLWPGSAGVPELAGFTRETPFSAGSIQLNAYSRNDTGAIESLEELRGKRLILIRGYTYFRLLDELKADPDTYVTIAPDHASAIRMLAFRRGDYLINFQAPMDATLARTPLPGLVQTNLLSWPLGFIFSTAAPGTETMIREFSRAWSELQAEGMAGLSDG